jgi:hypothetical protein
MVRLAGKSLGELGYDEKTPPYYILSAVLFDWTNGGNTNESVGSDTSADM